MSNEFSEFLAWERASRDTIDFKVAYVDMAGGDVIAGLLLSQIVFWHLPGKQDGSKLRVERDGHKWLVKTRKEWYDEIRLSPAQVDRALIWLKSLGIIQTARHRFDGAPTTHIRLDHDIFMARWEAVVGNSEIRESRNSGKSKFGKVQNGTSTNLNMEIQESANSISATAEILNIDYNRDHTETTDREGTAAVAAPPPPEPIAAESQKPRPTKAAQPTRRVSTANQRTPEQHALCEELVDGLQEVTGMLRQTNRSALYTAGWTLVDLLNAGIAPSKGHLLKAFGLSDPGPGCWWWYRDDQRVKMDLDKGRAAPMPKPHQVAEMYSVSLKPPPAVSGPSPGRGRNSEAWQQIANSPTLMDLRRERERKAEEERRRQYGIK